MQNPGKYSLGDFSLTSADRQDGEWIEDLDGMIGVTVQATLAVGDASSDAAVSVFLQTSIDGTRPVDIARFDFEGGGTRILNIDGSAISDAITPTDGALEISSDSGAIINGCLGDRLRAVAISEGEFSGSTLLSVSVTVR